MKEQNVLDEKRFFLTINELLSITNLEELLSNLSHKIPSMLNARDCSIFLTPDLIGDSYDGQLVKTDGTIVPATNLDEDFIVLASTTRPEFRQKIGKAYYRKGQGLTGWIFMHNQALLTPDLNKCEYFKDIDPQPVWTDSYGGAKSHASASGKLPFIGIPLTKKGTTFGVLRVAGTLSGDRFARFYEGFLNTMAEIVSNLIEKVTTIDGLRSSLGFLFDQMKVQGPEKVAFDIVDDVAKRVGANNCELYVLGERGEKVVLRAATSPFMTKILEDGRSNSYSRGKGLTGWVFKTGKPLRIEHINDFRERRRLTDEELEEFSNGPEIDSDDDRYIEWVDLDGQYVNHPSPHPYFLGVPIKSSDDEVIGVLRVSSSRSKTFFDRLDMELLEIFAKSLAALFEKERQRKLYDVLLKIGTIYDEGELFNYVVNKIPDLVLGWGCSVFLKQKHRDTVVLKYTSSAHLLKQGDSNAGVVDLSYDYGKGKTGLAAQLCRPLLINYYGTGKLAQKKMAADHQRYHEDSNCLVHSVKNELKEEVGLALTFCQDGDDPFSLHDIDLFHNFANKQIFREGGLPSSKETQCETGGKGYAQCFLAVPIRLRAKKNELLGIIRIPRTTEGGRFSHDDLLLIESIAGRLNAALELEGVVGTLSDINSKINSPVGRDDILDEILKAVTDSLGYEFARIQFEDESDNTNGTAKVRKNPAVPDAADPEGWRGLKHPTDLPEDQDRNIPPQFSQDKLVVASEPIFAYDQQTHRRINIGTLEAGHNISRKANISNQERRILQAVANQVAIAIRHWQQREGLKATKDKALANQLFDLAEFIQHRMHNVLGIVRRKAERSVHRLKSFDRQHLDHMVNEMDAILRNTEEALEVSYCLSELRIKYKSLHRKNITFSDLEESIFDVISKQVSKKAPGIRLVKQIAVSPESVIYADKNLLYWTFEELVENAIAAISDRGSIKITATTRGGDYIFEVVDDGDGMTPKDLKLAFRAGYSNRGSTGIGLWLCKRVIKNMHDGEFEIQSEHGKGTRCTIKIASEGSSWGKIKRF